MYNAPTNGPAFCENDILFRYGFLLPKTTNPSSFSSIRTPISEDIDACNKPVSLQMGYHEP
jgi:hypothetical protein